ncbi:MAG TPA: HipA family kinase [Edaphobacter sp.]|nr:HipA family kinase [Edaphobacter sp.]
MHVPPVAKISEGVDISGSLITVIRAKDLIRKMHGGSQAILIRGDNKELYVVKCNNNPQGPNLLANEMLGSEMLRCVGLPSPPWTAILITDEFLHHNQNLHFECSSGLKPIRSGIHFGTRFLSQIEGVEVYDFLPGSFRRRIANAADFLGIYIFDVWANHHDHRQAVYVSRFEDRIINAHFIDNGHLFGGPYWGIEEKYGTAMCLDRNLYTTPWDDKAINEWISRFEISISQHLYRIVKRVPQDWYKGDIGGIAEFLEFRLWNLRELFQRELRHNRRLNSGLLETGFSDASMQLCDSRSLRVRSSFGLCSLPFTSKN